MYFNCAENLVSSQFLNVPVAIVPSNGELLTSQGDVFQLGTRSQGSGVWRLTPGGLTAWRVPQAASLERLALDVSGSSSESTAKGQS